VGIAPFVAALRRLRPGGAPATVATGGAYPVTFPQAILRIRVELYLGGVWVDITSYVQHDPGIDIERGRTPSQHRTRIARCSLTLRNDGREFSPRNASGPWYGLLRQNTPIRVYVDPGSGDSLRFTGRVPSWRPRMKGHPNDRDVRIEAYGRRNQLEIGDEALESAQYRWLSTAANLLQYRPMEGNGEGTVTGPPGSGNLPDLAQGGVHSDFPTSGPVDSWRVEIDAKFGLDKATADFAAIIRWNTGGTIGEWRLSADDLQAQLTYTVQATGAQTILDTGIDVYDGVWHHYQVDAEQNGTGIDIVIRIDGDVAYTNTIASHTLGQIGFWLVQDDDPGAGADRMPAVGHVAIYGPIPADTTSAYAAFTGWTGETPAARFARLCTENGIPYVVRELVADGERMGPQGRETLTTLLDECEDTAEGWIDEDFGNTLRLTSRTALWNQPVALTLDYQASPSHIQPPQEPSDDSELMRNQWSISRAGSDDPAAVARLLSGPLNVNDPEDDPLGVGPVKDAATLSLATTAQAAQHAAYRVARDTLDEPRFPRVGFNLAHAPDLIPQWLACDFGSRVVMVNPPSDVGIDAPDVILAGYDEHIRQEIWTVDAFLDAGGVYRQGTYAGPGAVDPLTAARYDCAGSTLATALAGATGAGTVDVAITDTCAWAHDTGDYDIMIDAEAITVTAVGAVGGTYPTRTQTLTVVRAANGVEAAHAVGDEIHVRNRGRYAL
jgi:hypothetical protein